MAKTPTNHLVRVHPPAPEPNPLIRTKTERLPDPADSAREQDRSKAAPPARKSQPAGAEVAEAVYARWRALQGGPMAVFTAARRPHPGDLVYYGVQGTLRPERLLLYAAVLRTERDTNLSVCCGGVSTERYIFDKMVRLPLRTDSDLFHRPIAEEKPFIPLLEFTAQNTPINHLFTESDISGLAFSVSELEVCSYICAAPANARAAFANQFTIIAHHDTRSFSHGLFTYPLKSEQTSYGCLHMKQAPPDGLWQGYAVISTADLARCSSYKAGADGTTKGLRNRISCFSINGFRGGAPADFAPGTHFVVRGR